jgi:uncharacterized RDD family membrane protein YckC
MRGNDYGPVNKRSAKVRVLADWGNREFAFAVSSPDGF